LEAAVKKEDKENRERVDIVKKAMKKYFEKEGRQAKPSPKGRGEITFDNTKVC
jgi:hypothetical protein